MRSHLFKRNTIWVFVRSALLTIVLLAFTALSAGATPSQLGVSWNYRLLGKLNSSLDPTNGWTILITGSGSLNTIQNSINGGGEYTILDWGKVVGSGVWQASSLIKFDSMGPGNSPGEGGHLELMATFSGSGTGALTGSQPVVIQCSMWGPRVGPTGYPWPPDFVEVGPYTTHATGGVMFNLNQ